MTRSYLAVEEGVSASTQRQALNAGVFFLREVRKLDLGDFSVETTMIYLHVMEDQKDLTLSPLDTL
ncbi:MAG: hypothetical protein ACLFRP_08830 [Puniceicoccaceae bacterium]